MATDPLAMLMYGIFIGVVALAIVIYLMVRGTPAATVEKIEMVYYKDSLGDWIVSILEIDPSYTDDTAADLAEMFPDCIYFEVEVFL